MNRQDRKDLQNIGLMLQQAYDKLQEVYDILSDATEQIEYIKDSEQDKYDNAPESLQESERYQTIYDGIDTLQDLYDSIEELQSSIEDVQSNIEDVESHDAFSL